MPRVRVSSFGVSLDGYSAGPDQSLAHPLGKGFDAVMSWFFPTRVFREKVLGQPDGETGVDNGIAEKGFENIGAWILGRNMFSPGRGAWDMDWRGWWGEEPVYHCPVFVLTHYPRPPLEMKGGTTFHFITDGVHAALERAKDAAGNRDVRIGGGAATVRAYLQARLVDELHLAMGPVFLGRGENLFAGLDLPTLGYECHQLIAGERATHLLIRRSTRG